MTGVSFFLLDILQLNLLYLDSHSGNHLDVSLDPNDDKGDDAVALELADVQAVLENDQDC